VDEGCGAGVDEGGCDAGGGELVGGGEEAGGCDEAWVGAADEDCWAGVLDSAAEGADEGVTEGAGADEAGGGADEAGEAGGESGEEEGGGAAEETAAAVAVAESAGGAEETREGNVLAVLLADMMRIARRTGSQAGGMKSRLDDVDELKQRCGMRQTGGRRTLGAGAKCGPGAAMMYGLRRRVQESWEVSGGEKRLCRTGGDGGGRRRAIGALVGGSERRTCQGGV
jgi:hypothetical protein